MRASGPPTTSSAMRAWTVRRAAGGFGGPADLGDIFGGVFRDIFGGGRGGGGQSYRGADLRYTLDLTLEEAVFGTTAKIRVPTLVTCATCAGSGAKPGTKPTTCPTCRGVGQVRMQQGFFSIQQTCPRCQGRGTVIPEPCETCRGSGRVEEQKTLSVKVPAGVDNGDRIRLAGEGEAGRARRAAGRSVRADSGQAASDLHPRGQRSVLRGADQLHHGGAGRRFGSADPGRAAEPEDSARDPDRQGVPDPRQGRQAGARRRRPAICCAGPSSKPRST